MQVNLQISLLTAADVTMTLPHLEKGLAGYCCDRQGLPQWITLRSSNQKHGCAWRRFQCICLQLYDFVHGEEGAEGAFMDHVQLVKKGSAKRSARTPATRLDNAAARTGPERNRFSGTTFMERLKAPSLSPANESAPADHQLYCIGCCCLWK